MRVLALAPGPDLHGVVQHGLAVAAAVRRAGAEVTVARSLGADLDADAPYDLTHVQFTDGIFGPDVAAAAEAFAAEVARLPRPVVVTLHDVPGRDPDRGRDARRLAGYARVARSADAVVVSAEHEAGPISAPGRRPHVVPLPVPVLAPSAAPPVWADRPTVGVLGFVYPGKGHDVALEAVALVAAADGVRATVVAAGGTSPGHDQLAEALQRQADHLGVELLLTGPLGEAELHAAARAVTVPLAAYRTLGASGSLATWAAAGRRPLTTPTAYATDLERRRPGSLQLVPEAELVPALARALADPAGTRLAAAGRPDDTAQAHLAVYRSVLS